MPRSTFVRRRLIGAAMVLVIAGLVLALILQAGGGGKHNPVLLPGPAFKSPADDPFGYAPGRARSLVAAASAAEEAPLFERSPGGVPATARRVARWRPLIVKAARGSGIDPNTLEGIVFLESAGYQNVVAGGDLAGAAGLTQILAQTGSGLLGMRVDLAASKRLTAEISRSLSAAHVKRLLARRARIDERFDPAKALAATVRYLKLARRTLGRDDLAVVSYHMGIGNLQHVISAYGAGTPSYVQLYFDAQPDDHAAAWKLLSSFGDESSLYYWKVLGAERLMALYRSGAALRQAAPPAAGGSLVGLPSQPGRIFLRYGRGLRGLTPGARAMLVYVAARVHAISKSPAPLTVSQSNGATFAIARRYAGPAQAQAFQFALDRLTVEHLITWQRGVSAIRLRVSSAADALLPRLRPLR